MALMRKAMDYITKLNPCVTFVPANSSSRNFVTIDSGPTCSSEVGMRGGEQLLNENLPFSHAVLTNPKMLWPSGVVEYKFYRTFPR